MDKNPPRLTKVKTWTDSTDLSKRNNGNFLKFDPLPDPVQTKYDPKERFAALAVRDEGFSTAHEEHREKEREAMSNPTDGGGFFTHFSSQPVVKPHMQPHEKRTRLCTRDVIPGFKGVGTDCIFKDEGKARVAIRVYDPLKIRGFATGEGAEIDDDRPKGKKICAFQATSADVRMAMLHDDGIDNTGMHQREMRHPRLLKAPPEPLPPTACFEGFHGLGAFDENKGIGNRRYIPPRDHQDFFVFNQKSPPPVGSGGALYPRALGGGVSPPPLAYNASNASKGLWNASPPPPPRRLPKAEK